VVGVIGKDCQCKLYADDLKIYSEIKHSKMKIYYKAVVIRVSTELEKSWKTLGHGKVMEFT